MSKKTIIQEAYVQFNSHFNYRWQYSIAKNFCVVAPSSVQLVWSLLHPAL